jgi:hypothetical protein
MLTVSQCCFDKLFFIKWFFHLDESGSWEYSYAEVK